MSSHQDLRALSEDLFDSWKIFGRPPQLHQPLARKGKAPTNEDATRMLCVEGLTRHVYEMSRSIVLLLDEGQMISAVPLVRLVYETALTAAWLVNTEGQHGVTAFLHEHARQNKNLQSELKKSFVETFREHAVSMADTDQSPYVGALDSTQRFRQICNDLTPGGPDAYIYYRLLSSLSHPGVAVTDLYFEGPSLGSGIPQRRSEPATPLNGEFLLFLTCASMVWAGRAFSYLSKEKAHRSSLKSAARQLGITAELKLGDEYFIRHARRKNAGRQ